MIPTSIPLHTLPLRTLYDLRRHNICLLALYFLQDSFQVIGVLGDLEFHLSTQQEFSVCEFVALLDGVGVGVGRMVLSRVTGNGTERSEDHNIKVLRISEINPCM